MFAIDALEQEPSSFPNNEASRFSSDLYTSLWHFVSDANRIVSVLGGMDLSTSALSLLNTKGRSSLCNCEIIVFFASSSSTSRSNLRGRGVIQEGRARSPPGTVAVGGLFFDFEAIRASRRRRARHMGKNGRRFRTTRRTGPTTRRRLVIENSTTPRARGGCSGGVCP